MTFLPRLIKVVIIIGDVGGTEWQPGTKRGSLLVPSGFEMIFPLKSPCSTYENSR